MDYAVARLTTDVSRRLKPSHVRTLLDCTYRKDITMSDLFRLLTDRLRNEKWIVVFKTLSLIHLLMREGNSERILGFAAGNIDFLQQAMHRAHGQQATKLIKTYVAYLQVKVEAYRAVKYDWIVNQDEAVAKLRSISDKSEILKQTEVLQKQIEKAISCDWEVDMNSDVVLQQGYRFMLAEHFNLFLLANENIVRLLGVYFEMNREQATKGLELYKNFVTQTKKQEDFFQNAKQNLERVDIPKFKVPPVSLANALEGYLNSPEFEQQLAGNKNTKKSIDDLGTPLTYIIVKESEKGKAVPAKEKPLIDFFNTIEEEMAGYNRSASPQMPQFNTMWNDQFNDIQNQIQQTNQLLNQNQGGNNFGQPSYNPFGQQQQQNVFSQSNFSQMNQGQQQYNPFMASNSPQQGFQQTPFPNGGLSSIKEASGFTVDNVFGNSAFQPAPIPSNNNFAQSNASNPFQQSGVIQPQQTGMLQQQNTGMQGMIQPQATGFQMQQNGILQQQNTGMQQSNFQQQPQNPFNNTGNFGNLSRVDSREDVFSSLGQTLPTMKKLQAQSTGNSNFQSPISLNSQFQPMKSQMTGQSVATSYASPAMSSPFQQPLQSQVFGNSFQSSGLSNNFNSFQSAQTSQGFQPHMSSFQQQPLKANMTGSSLAFQQNNTSSGLSGGFSQSSTTNNNLGGFTQNSSNFTQNSSPLNPFNSNQNSGFSAQGAAPSNPFNSVPNTFAQTTTPLNPFNANSTSPAMGFNQGNQTQGGIANNFRAPLTSTNSTQHGYGVQNQPGSNLGQQTPNLGQQPFRSAQPNGFDNFGNPIQNQFLTSNSNAFA